MAIEQGQMHWRFGDVMLNQNGLHVRWEVYHPSTKTVIESGVVSVPEAKTRDLAQAWTLALNQMQAAANDVYERHKAVAGIQGYSRFDAGLILDGWLHDPVAETLVHPISGEFEDVTFDGLPGLVNAILGVVPGPPMWFWAESVEAGALRVKCVAVAGADSYNVYNGTDFLGNVPSAAWNALAVPAGNYQVRIAAVGDGQVGVCSFPVAVVVG